MGVLVVLQRCTYCTKPGVYRVTRADSVLHACRRHVGVATQRQLADGSGQVRVDRVLDDVPTVGPDAA